MLVEDRGEEFKIRRDPDVIKMSQLSTILWNVIIGGFGIDDRIYSTL
jgi:hypothetical protein